MCINKGNEKQFTFIWQSLVVKNVPANSGDVRDTGFIPESGRSVDEGINPLRYSCLENAMDRGVGQYIVHTVTKSRTQLKRLSTHAGQNIHSFIHCLNKRPCKILCSLSKYILQGFNLTLCRML